MAPAQLDLAPARRLPVTGAVLGLCYCLPLSAWLATRLLAHLGARAGGTSLGAAEIDAILLVQALCAAIALPWLARREDLRQGLCDMAMLLMFAWPLVGLAWLAAGQPPRLPLGELGLLAAALPLCAAAHLAFKRLRGRVTGVATATLQLALALPTWTLLGGPLP